MIFAILKVNKHNTILLKMKFLIRLDSWSFVKKSAQLSQKKSANIALKHAGFCSSEKNRKIDWMDYLL